MLLILVVRSSRAHRPLIARPLSTRRALIAHKCMPLLYCGMHDLPFRRIVAPPTHCHPSGASPPLLHIIVPPAYHCPARTLSSRVGPPLLAACAQRRLKKGPRKPLTVERRWDRRAGGTIMCGWGDNAPEGRQCVGGATMRRKGKSCIAHNKAAAALLRVMQDSPLPRIITPLAPLAHHYPSYTSLLF